MKAVFTPRSECCGQILKWNGELRPNTASFEFNPTCWHQHFQSGVQKDVSDGGCMSLKSGQYLLRGNLEHHNHVVLQHIITSRAIIVPLHSQLMWRRCTCPRGAKHGAGCCTSHWWRRKSCAPAIMSHNYAILQRNKSLISKEINCRICVMVELGEPACRRLRTWSAGLHADFMRFLNKRCNNKEGKDSRTS